MRSSSAEISNSTKPDRRATLARDPKHQLVLHSHRLKTIRASTEILIQI